MLLDMRLKSLVMFGLFLIPVGTAFGDIADLVARAESTPRASGDKLNPPRCKRNVAGEIVSLNLDYVRLQTGDLEEIVKCDKLESLSLMHTNITDEQLKALAELKRLRSLTLNHTTIGDAGLKHIGQIRSLKFLCLGGVDATDDGVKQLRQDLPKLEMGYFRRLPPKDQQ